MNAGVSYEKEKVKESQSQSRSVTPSLDTHLGCRVGASQLQLNLFGYVGYYRILVLTFPLQLNFTVIIEVLFKLLIMMSSMNVLNIVRLIVTSFVIICFRVYSHFSLFPLKIS